MIIVSKQDLRVDQVCKSIGFDCGVHFVQRSTTRLLSIVKSVAKRKRGHSLIVVKVGNATNILNRVDFSLWWVDRVRVIRRRNGNQFGVLRPTVDLLA